MAASFHFGQRLVVRSLLRGLLRGLLPGRLRASHQAFLGTLVGAVVGWLPGGPFRSARAAEGVGDIPCELVETGTLHVDGMLSDWQGAQAVELAGVPQQGAKILGTGRPLKVRVRCNYDTQAVYLAVEVEDDIVARTKAAGPGEDHLEIAFAVPLVKGGVDRLMLWPSSWSQKLPRVVRWASGRSLRIVEGEGPAGRTRPWRGPPAFEVYDALQTFGYAVELRLPKSLLPGYHEGTPLPLSVAVFDGDSRARPEVVAIARTSPQERPEDLSRLVFQEGESALATMLADLKLSHDDIHFDRTGDLGAGDGRVLLVGRFLAVVGKEYLYQELAPHQQDLRDPQLVDVDGRKALAVRVVDRGGGGSREILRLYQVAGGMFHPIFAAEVAKQRGKDQLRTTVTYVKKGKLTEIVLVPQPAVGFTADSYQEAPAEDVQPILLPWRDKRARYVLKNGAYVRAE